MREEFYNVLVFSEVLVEHEFHLELLWAEFAMLKRMGFVYEFDCDYGCGCVEGNGLADAILWLVTSS